MANKTIDLDNPKDAKKFLRGVRFQGKAIKFVTTADNKEINIEEMTDQQLVRYAKDIYLYFCGGEEGVKGEIELETENQGQ